MVKLFLLNYNGAQIFCVFEKKKEKKPMMCGFLESSVLCIWYVSYTDTRLTSWICVTFVPENVSPLIRVSDALGAHGGMAGHGWMLWTPRRARDREGMEPVDDITSVNQDLSRPVCASVDPFFNYKVIYYLKKNVWNLSYELACLLFIALRSAVLISRLKNTVDWFILREKHCFG
jgi:hypothetical protein